MLQWTGKEKGNGREPKQWRSSPWRSACGISSGEEHTANKMSQADRSWSPVSGFLPIPAGAHWEAKLGAGDFLQGVFPAPLPPRSLPNTVWWWKRPKHTAVWQPLLTLRSLGRLEWTHLTQKNPDVFLKSKRSRNWSCQLRNWGTMSRLTAITFNFSPGARGEMKAKIQDTLFSWVGVILICCWFGGFGLGFFCFFFFCNLCLLLFECSLCTHTHKHGLCRPQAFWRERASSEVWAAQPLMQTHGTLSGREHSSVTVIDFDSLLNSERSTSWVPNCTQIRVVGSPLCLAHHFPPPTPPRGSSAEHVRMAWHGQLLHQNPSC